MVNTLEAAKLCTVNVHVARSVKWHRTVGCQYKRWYLLLVFVVKQEYRRRGMAVLHQRTHQWQKFTVITAPVD